MTDIPDGYVAVARVLGAWGVRGEISIEALAAEEFFAKGRPVTISGSEARIERATGSGNRIRLKLTGVNDRETAAALRGAWVLAREDNLPALPNGEFYRFQLLGMSVVSTAGELLGEISDIFSTPENDVYVVRGNDREILVPAVDDVIQEIDVASHTVTIEVIPGLLP